MRYGALSWLSGATALQVACAPPAWQPPPVTPTPRERALLGCWQVPTGIGDQTLLVRLDSALFHDSLPQRSQHGLVLTRALRAHAPAPPGGGFFLVAWAVHPDADSVTVYVSYGLSGHQFVGAIEPDVLVGRVDLWSDIEPAAATWLGHAVARRASCARGAT